MRRDRSILDSVTEKVADLQRGLGAARSLKLDEYLEAVRDVERRIQKAEEQSAQRAAGRRAAGRHSRDVRRARAS